MFAEHCDVDHCPVDVTQFDRAQQTFDAVDYLQPSTVAERQDKSKPSVAGSLLDRSVQLFLRALRQISQSPNRLEADVFLNQFRRFLLQKSFQQTHQRDDLSFRTLPVFSRKS